MQVLAESAHICVQKNEIGNPTPKNMHRTRKFLKDF